MKKALLQSEMDSYLSETLLRLLPSFLTKKVLFLSSHYNLGEFHAKLKSLNIDISKSMVHFEYVEPKSVPVITSHYDLVICDRVTAKFDMDPDMLITSEIIKKKEPKEKETEK